jgi:hypothetical protein
MCKIVAQTPEREKKTIFGYWQYLFLSSVVKVSEHIWEEFFANFELVLESESKQKLWIRIRKKICRIHNSGFKSVLVWIRPGDQRADADPWPLKMTLLKLFGLTRCHKVVVNSLLFCKTA